MQNVKEKKETTSEPRSNKFEGKIVSLAGDKLSVTSKAGKSYSYRLAKEAKITWDGKACKAENLKVGSEIRITTKPDDRNLVVEVESIKELSKAENCCS